MQLLTMNWTGLAGGRRWWVSIQLPLQFYNAMSMSISSSYSNTIIHFTFFGLFFLSFVAPVIFTVFDRAVRCAAAVEGYTNILRILIFLVWIRKDSVWIWWWRNAKQQIQRYTGILWGPLENVMMMMTRIPLFFLKVGGILSLVDAARAELELLLTFSVCTAAIREYINYFLFFLLNDGEMRWDVMAVSVGTLRSHLFGERNK